MGGNLTESPSIWQACRVDDRAFVELWLLNAGNPNQIDRQGWTPLLIGCARGYTELVSLLLTAPNPANPDMPFLPSGALPIHLAGQAGSVEVAALLFQVRPSHLEEIWPLNGHTLLLQAAFYGHVELLRWALAHGASTAATTVRGLGAMELASQFENHELMELIRPCDSSADAKNWHFKTLLAQIAPFVPYADREKQAAVDAFVQTIADAVNPVSAAALGSVRDPLSAIREQLDSGQLDPNGLGGPLQQPPLVVAVTGGDGSPPRSEIVALRYAIVCELLDRGANPRLPERHPMAVDTIIRAAVFAHLDILKEIARRIGTAQMAEALNLQPTANGLTALHDSVLRASTAGPDHLQQYIAQIEWFTEIGALSNIQDFSGRTQAEIAMSVTDPVRRNQLLAALKIHS